MTCEHSYVDDERSCFWTWDDTEGVWQSRSSKGRQLKRKRICGQKKTLLDDSKDVRARSQKAFIAIKRVVFVLSSHIKVQARIIPRTKARESSKKEKAKKKLILDLYFQPLKHLKKKDIAIPGNLMTGHPVSGLMILGLQLQDGMARKLTLLG